MAYNRGAADGVRSSTGGSREALLSFVVVRHSAEIVGCAGLEAYGASGLLRSVAVAPAWRHRGVAHALTTWLLDAARVAGLADVSLLTTTAADYFLRLGFTVIARAETPEAVRESVEFRDACPASAAVMTREL